MSPTTALSIRKRIGYVFQAPIIFDHLSVKDNFAVHGQWKGLTRDDAVKQGLTLLTKFDLSEFMKQKPLYMSMGQRQRVALIMALLGSPELLLLDEPLGSIDFETKALIVDHLAQIKEEHDITMLIVTHDTAFDQLATTIRYLKDGTLE